ncbi:DNRLRE domain-containing protein [Niallia sp. FSL R7-0271]|uniref:DNRLRE domain-containing protein n=1 Tax=Niallia sp. FSL R7-0271 TaxID=2921678 RepID=UPI0030FB8097
MFKKFMAISLSILLILSLVPNYVLAETSNEDESIQNQQNNNTNDLDQNLEEVESKRDEYSKTYTDGEGNFTTEVYAEPIHTKLDGSWEEISTDISMNQQNGMLETDTTQLKASYPSKISSKEEIQYKYEGHTLEFSNIVATDGTEEYSLQQNGDTITEDNKVIYKNLLPGIDLRHVSLNNEVKEDWIITDYKGINQFNYVVNTDLVPKLNDDGSIDFFESQDLKKKVFVLPTPMMEDSNINKGLGNGTKSTNLHYELESISNNEYSIKLIVDKAWLEAEDRVYPVYVDPSVSVDAMGDSFVSSASPNTNFNKEWDSVQGEYVLKVGKYDSSTGTNYAFIKFSLTNLKGAVVDSADFKTYVTHSYYATQKTGLWLDRVTGPWYADELTWNNKPGSTKITSTTVARDQWATFPVKDTVQSWIDGEFQNDGFKLHTNGNGQTYWKKLSSAETENVAKLVISYHYPTMKNPVLKAAQTSSGSTTGYINVSWPEVYGAESYELQMFNGKSFEKVYSGTGTSWSSKGKKIFPKTPYSTSSSYKLDGSGVELPVDPSSYFSTKSGTSTTRKEYGFRVLARYKLGNSPVSSEVKKAIPSLLIDTPDYPEVKGSAYPETDVTNKDRGWLDIKWDAVDGATGYKVLIYNGKDYESFNVGNVTSWTTKGQKIWPTSSEIASGKYALHHDKNGSELPIDPRQTYTNANDGYQSFTRYSIRVVAVGELGETPSSGANYGYIPLNSPKNIKVNGNITDFVNNKGVLNVTWDTVTGAQNYQVELYNGKTYKTFEVDSNKTSWTSKGKSLFDSITDLPADPTEQYKDIGSSDQTLINNKQYQVRVKAFRFSDDTAPPSEDGKITGPRALSTPSAIQKGNIPLNEELIGLEDYFTFSTHHPGNAKISVNVTTGNIAMSFDDYSLYARGTLGFNYTRVYNSNSSKLDDLGQGWTFMGNESLTKKDNSANSTIYYEEEDGTKHTFAYDENTKKYTSANGKYLTLTSETVSDLPGFKITDTNGLTQYFEQDPSSATKYRIHAYQDTNKNKILFKYEGNQLNEIAEVDSSDNIIRNSIKLSYADNLISKASYNQQSIEYKYNTKKQLIETITSAEKTDKSLVEKFDYDENGKLTEYTDSKGHVNTISYGENEITILEPQSVDSESVSTTYKFDYVNNQYTKQDTQGNTTTYKRDTVNDTFAVADTINASGNHISTKYDSNYNQISINDDGEVENNTFDDKGNLLSSTSSDGKVTTYKYDSDSNIIEKIEPDGIVTSYKYEKGHYTKKVGDELTEYYLDDYGRVTKTILPNSTYQETIYNDSENTVKTIDSKGNTTLSNYNNYGNVVSLQDGEGRKTQYLYEDPLQPDLKTGVIDGSGATTKYKYDDNGNLISITDALGNETSYTHNGNNQVTKVEYPINDTEKLKIQSEYDSNGNLLKTIENSGISKNYGYNELSDLTSVVVNKNNQNVLGWTIDYNENNQASKVIYKDLLSNNILLQKEYYYDSQSSLLEKFLQGKYEINYLKYDENDRLETQEVIYNESSLPWNIKLTNSYTNEGRELQSSINVDGSDKVKLDYKYDFENNTETRTINDSLTSKYSYGKDNQITNIDYLNGGNSFLTYSYLYDKSGNITKEKSNKGEKSYIYDANNQLSEETLLSGDKLTYKFDTLGNRTEVVKNGKSLHSFTYNSIHQVTSKNGKQYKYDADGNLVQDENYKYIYNSLGQVIKVSNSVDDKEIARYEYDENGKRTKKILGTVSYEYYYDSEDLSLIVKRNNEQVEYYQYIQRDNTDKPVSMILKKKNSNGNWENKTYFIQTNVRGDVTKILDSAKNEVASYDYDSYGNVLNEVGEFAKENAIRYAGYYYDVETKHYYLNARYYNPENGSFLTIDPLSGNVDDPLSQNGYTYAQNNPMRYTDPLGTKVIEYTEGFLDMLHRHEKEARKHKYNLKWFYNQVRNKGPWDLKQRMNLTYKIWGKKVSGEALGNIHYGYIGTATGITKATLLSAAGVAQIRAGTSGWKYWYSRFDDPKDQSNIKWGIDLYYKYRKYAKTITLI